MRAFYTEIITSCRRLRCCLLGSLLFGQIFLPCNAFSSGLLIVYPRVKAPYNKIYQDIIKGIENTYPGTTQRIELMANPKNNGILKKIIEYQPDVLVTLGKKSLAQVRLLKPDIPIVAGAITKTRESVIGVSMIPDSEVILSKLLLITPYVERVYVVTNSDRQSQLQRADDYLTRQGKTLHVEQATSVQQAADNYLKIINQASENDAIWLMRGTALNDPSILMMVLKAAWNKKIVVFSSNPTHVKRGALFSVYPNNEKMGGTLAELAQRQEQEHTTDTTGLRPLRNVHLIVNKRTSKHLGIMPNSISGLNIHRLL